MNEDALKEPQPGKLTRKGVQPPPTEQNTTHGREDPPRRPIHTVKLETQYYERYSKRELSAQVRFNDRSYAAHDVMCVREFDPLLKIHTGNEYLAVVVSVDPVPGLIAGYVLLHTKKVA
ncbi:MAG: DUF3850 domain-containing protein [Casimicrobium sp.]